MKLDLSKTEKEIDYSIKQREANTKVYYLDRMVDELKNGYLCVFAGAGLSAASGYVDWKALLKPMGEQLGLNMNMDLTLLAQYYENKFTRDELNRRIMAEFAKIPQRNDNMEILASMPIVRYWTTNYDSIIEDTLRKNGKIVDVIKDQLQFKYHSPERDAVVFKMHGDREIPDKAILCKNDYETYDEERVIFAQGLMMDLISNTFLFIGFSFSDPNLDRIISIVRRNFKGASLKKHYCFLRDIKLEDYIGSDGDIGKVKEQYMQDKNAQECKIGYMRDYGIETILIDEFSQITQMLKYMSDKLKLSSIFISGGLNSNRPNDYGEFQRGDRVTLGKAEEFIMDLSNTLIEENYKLVTGFGVGVGNYVVAGAYKNRDRNTQRKFEEKVCIQPIISVEDDRLDIKNKIREVLLEKCGIVIFVFGKSVLDVEKEDLKEDGTYIEYGISKEMEKIIIPVGATGFTTKIIYNEEKAQWAENDNIYQILGDKSLDNSKLISNILQAIEYKKYKREEEMRKALIKNIFEENRKKVFVSFHYKSSVEYLSKITDVIKKSGHYWISEEIEKCDNTKIQQWIDDKIEDADVLVVIFNKEFSDSKWTEYEVRMGIKYNIPFLFLVNEDGSEEITQYLNKYIKQKGIKKYIVLKWKKISDFQKIPSMLNKLLKIC